MIRRRKLFAVPAYAGPGHDEHGRPHRGPCYACPFAHGSDVADRCTADPERREPVYFDSEPDWCPLRFGDVVVRLQPPEDDR